MFNMFLSKISYAQPLQAVSCGLPQFSRSVCQCQIGSKPSLRPWRVPGVAEVEEFVRNLLCWWWMSKLAAKLEVFEYIVHLLDTTDWKYLALRDV